MMTGTAPVKARQNGKEKKPRFEKEIYNNFITWINSVVENEPAYGTDSWARDKWLLGVSRKETILAGIMNSVTLIDSNRGWSIVGGRNQVYRWSDKLHQSANGQGWRFFAKKASHAFWNTDMGGVIGLKRDYPFATATRAGGIVEVTKSPLITLENIDPTRCRLYHQVAKPEELGGLSVESDLLYEATPLFDWDYFRVTSMPSVEDEYLNLGFCAVSRAIEFAKLMYAIYQYDQEKLGAKMQRGLLILHNITEEQWKTAMEARKDKMSALERNYYGGVQVLTDMGEFPIDAKLVALSNLPDGFDQEIMTNLLIYGYALCFGYDPREFWPVSSGSLGTGRETETQAAKATVKGQGDFRLTFQENLQKELPSTIHFEFDERNEEGELISQALLQAKADVINSMAAVRENTGPVFTTEEMRQLYANAGLIPEDWTMQDEESTATDEGELRQRYLENPVIRRACEQYYNEPIVRYSVKWENGVVRQKYHTLWHTGQEAISPKVWYTGDSWKLTQKDIERCKP